MSESNPTTLLLAVPGPEQYAAVPKTIVRNAIKQGQIRQSQLIWSPVHNDWMQVRDLPHLSQETQQLQAIPTRPEPVPAEPEATSQPTEKTSLPPKTQSLLAPVPAERTVTTTHRASAPVAKARVSVAKAAQPQVSAPKSISSSSRHQVDEEDDDGFPIFKILTIVLFCSIISILGCNFVLVNTPLRNSLVTTKYGSAQVYAHLFGFYQPNALVIHLFPSPVLNQDNLLDFLSSLAQSTPRTALQGNLFETVGLAPGYSVKFFIRGQDWNQFSLMTQATEEQKKTFLLQHLTDPAGNFLLLSSGSGDETAEPANLNDKNTEAWNTFAQSILQP